MASIDPHQPEPEPVSIAGEVAELPVDVPVIVPEGRATGTVVAVTLVGFCAFLNLYATQPLLPMFRREFNASEVIVSLTVSAAVLGVALAAPIMGLLADRIGRKRVIVTCLFGLAIATSLAGTSRGLPTLIAWRFLQGLCVPGIVAVTMAYISEESAAHHTGSIMAMYITGTVVGGFCGRFMMGWVSTHQGWRVAFMIAGLATALGTILILQLLPRARKFVRQTNAASWLSAAGAHLRNPRLLTTYFVGFVVLFTLVGTFTYVGFYLAAAPFSLGTTALGSLFAVYLIGAIVTPLGGRMIDKLGHRLMLVTALSMGAIGLSLTLSHILSLVIAGLAICCSGVFIGQSTAAAYVGKAAGHSRSSAAGLYVSLYYLGGSAGSILPGLLWKHGGWPACVALIITVQLITAVLAYKIWRD